MRLGGSIMKPYNSPREWLALVKEYGYSAVSFPVNSDAPRHVRQAYLQCCRDNDLVIGEVVIWRNVLSRDAAEAQQALDYSCRQLELAEEVGADIPVFVEHLPDHAAYLAAVKTMRKAAEKAGWGANDAFF